MTGSDSKWAEKKVRNENMQVFIMLKLQSGKLFRHVDVFSVKATLLYLWHIEKENCVTRWRSSNSITLHQYQCTYHQMQGSELKYYHKSNGSKRVETKIAKC